MAKGRKIYLTIVSIILTFSLVRMSAQYIPGMQDTIRTEPLTSYELLVIIKDFNFDFEKTLETVNKISETLKELEDPSNNDFWDTIVTGLKVIGLSLYIPIIAIFEVVIIVINFLILFTKLIGFKFDFIEL